MLKISQKLVNNLKTNNSNLYFVYKDKLLKSTVATVQKSAFDSESPKQKNSIVAAAFASLKPNKNSNDWDIVTPVTNNKLNSAKTVDDLLSVSEGSGTSRRHALKVVSILAEWSSTGKVKIADFENDSRFIKMCRILSKGAKINKNMIARSEDLSTVLSVTAEDEAARLVQNLDLSQLVKLMSTLATDKRRSIVLLRTISYHLSGTTEQINLKQSADLLYSMAQLNFIDENLIAKICNDITIELQKQVSKSSVIGSIITSFGLLKYKNTEILDSLGEWLLKNYKICRSQDIFTFFITIGSIDFIPNNSEKLFEELLPFLTEAEANKPSLWLNFVWSLVILNRASTNHIKSVLSHNFINKFVNKKSIASNLKLLNINGGAKYLVQDYDGDLLAPDSNIYTVSLINTKEKKEMVAGVISTLKNLIPNENHLRFNTETDFGYCIDIECLLDKTCRTVEFNKDNLQRNKLTKVAIQVLDYHDMCKMEMTPIGLHMLAKRVLEAQKYKVLTVPYTEFRITDKLVQRVKYLEDKLKNIVK